MTWTTRPRSEGAGALSYWKAGGGPPVILIHGVGLRAEAWGAVVPELAQYFTVFAIDMPGHGCSSLGTVTSLSDYIDRILAFADELDGTAAVIGHSMGALIAIEMAARMPNKIGHVGALSAVYRRTSDAAAAVQARAEALSAGGVSDPGATLARWFGPSPSGPGADAAEACRRWLTDGSQSGYAAAYTVFAEHDGPSESTLRTLKSKALIQTGANDPNSTPEMSQAMADLAPDAHIDIVDGAAHMLPMTHPKAVTRALLSTFRNAEPLA